MRASMTAPSSDAPSRLEQQQPAGKDTQGETAGSGAAEVDKCRPPPPAQQPPGSISARAIAAINQGSVGGLRVGEGAITRASLCVWTRLPSGWANSASSADQMGRLFLCRGNRQWGVFQVNIVHWREVIQGTFFLTSGFHTGVTWNELLIIDQKCSVETMHARMLAWWSMDCPSDSCFEPVSGVGLRLQHREAAMQPSIPSLSSKIHNSVYHVRETPVPRQCLILRNGHALASTKLWTTLLEGFGRHDRCWETRQTLDSRLINCLIIIAFYFT